MENQVVTPNQPTNNQAPPSPTPGSLPSQEPPKPPTPPPAPSPGPGLDFNEDKPGKEKFGMLSLLLGSSAVGIFILLVFVTSLVDSLTKAYIWFFVILVLGVAGLVFGLLSEKGKPRINLFGLVGIILSVIVCVNCLMVGSFYIKTLIELNNFQSQFESTNYSDFEYDSSDFEVTQ